MTVLGETRPDVLVLGAGGTVGRAWMAGVLAGIEEATGWDFRECDAFVGTSAGSIVAAALAAGHRPDAGDLSSNGAKHHEDEGDEPSAVERVLEAAGRIGIGAVRPAAGLALRAAAPAGAAIRAAMLARAPRGSYDIRDLARRMESLGARFDGRLSVVAVDLGNGRRTVFGADGAPRPRVANAVLASCAIPGVFPPVEIDGREYVDGGVWSLTNLDIAPASRGQRVLCLNPTGRSRAAGVSLTSGLASWSRARAAIEEETLRGRGVAVATVGPDRPAAEALGPNLMDWRRAGPGSEAGYRQGLRLARG